MCICTSKKLCTKMFITKHISYHVYHICLWTSILATLLKAKTKLFFTTSQLKFHSQIIFSLVIPLTRTFFNLFPCGPIYSSHHSDLCVPKFSEVGFITMSVTQNDIPFPTWGWNVSCTRLDGCLSDNAQNIKRIWETNEGKY